MTAQHDEGADARHAGEAGFFARLAERYDGFEHLFQHEEPAEAETLCGLGERGTPSCNNCLANVKAPDPHPNPDPTPNPSPKPTPGQRQGADSCASFFHPPPLVTTVRPSPPPASSLS